MISVSRSPSREARQHVVFDETAPKNIHELCLAVVKNVWSPIIWTGGERKKTNFVRSMVVALDFDKPSDFTLKAAEEFCHDWKLSHVIGTTKSHQKKKVSPSGRIDPACDRFRMIFVADSWVSDLETYEWNMAEAVEMFDCDPSCTDGARFFWPCSTVVSYGVGEKWKWLPLPVDYVSRETRRRLAHEKAERYRASGTLPGWIRDILSGREEIDVGGRHKTCYKLSAHLTLFGWDEDAIVDVLLKTPLADIGPSDVRRAVHNGAMAAYD